MKLVAVGTTLIIAGTVAWIILLLAVRVSECHFWRKNDRRQNRERYTGPERRRGARTYGAFDQPKYD